MALRQTVLALPAAALALAFASAAQAQNEEETQPTLRCPVGELTETTSELPTAWARQPRTGELENTSVHHRSGNLVLTCHYGVAGSVTRDMPNRFESCFPTEGGFVCEKRTRQPRFASRGLLTVNAGAGVDLDRGESGAFPRDNDVWFSGRANGMPVLESFNNAALAARPDVERPDDCRDAQFRPGPLIVGTDVNTGQSVCYRTNEGRVGQMKIHRADDMGVRVRHWTLPKPE